MKFDKKNDINPKYLLILFTCICLAFVLISYFAGDKVSTVKGYVTKIISPLQKGINDIGLWTDSKFENIQEIEELNAENDRLEEQIASYEEQITSYQNQLVELETLRSLYELDEVYVEYNKTVANVYAKDSSSWFSSFYIDKGSNDGLYAGANVLCQHGVAGIVIDCYEDNARVRAIIDDSSNIKVKILPSSALCTLEGNLSVYQEGYLEVKNIDKNAEVNVGDKVVTSDISDRFFPGLLVGYVTEITLDSNNLTMTAKVTPAVDFNNISKVLIITDEKETIDFEEE